MSSSARQRHSQEAAGRTLAKDSLSLEDVSTMSEEENVIYPLKKKARSSVPAPFQGAVTNLINQGQIQSLLDFWIDERAGLGLPEKPFSAYSSEKAVQQSQEIIKELGFDRSLHFDWKQKRLKT